jgi:large subunit ribosomal protein L35
LFLAKAKVKLKLKTHKGAAKRFKLTATGKVVRGHAYARHILTSKSSKRKRKLDQTTLVDPSDVRRIRRMLPYGR